MVAVYRERDVVVETRRRSSANANTFTTTPFRVPARQHTHTDSEGKHTNKTERNGTMEEAMDMLLLHDTDSSLMNVSLSSFEAIDEQDCTPGRNGSKSDQDGDKSIQSNVNGAFPHQLQYEDVVLTKRVADKRCRNGKIFHGLLDAVTGEPVRGKLESMDGGSVYEGSFSRGKRHDSAGVMTDCAQSIKVLGR